MYVLYFDYLNKMENLYLNSVVVKTNQLQSHTSKIFPLIFMQHYICTDFSFHILSQSYSKMEFQNVHYIECLRSFAPLENVFTMYWEAIAVCHAVLAPIFRCPIDTVLFYVTAVEV